MWYKNCADPTKHVGVQDFCTVTAVSDIDTVCKCTIHASLLLIMPREVNSGVGIVLWKRRQAAIVYHVDNRYFASLFYVHLNERRYK